MKTIALTGGGSAGHVMPNLSLLPELKKHFDRVIYIGAGGMEEELAKRAGLAFFKTETVRLERAHLLKNLEIPAVLYRAVRAAKQILTAEKVCCVFAKGGYVSLPAALAAKRLHIPVVCHESDMSFGVANRLIARFAAGVITSFPETKGGVCLGNPVRDEIFFGDPNKAKRELKLSDLPTVLIVGGSLGAEALNRAVWAGLDKLCNSYNVLHVSGNGYDQAVTHNGYTQFPMTDRIPDLYAVADVVVTRAGANALAELTALGKRVIAVPLPKGASRGDQVQNAQSYQKRGLIEVLPQAELTADSLLAAIDAALKKQPPQGTGRGKTNAQIAQLIAKTTIKKPILK